jgi:hypothetical protein
MSLSPERLAQIRAMSDDEMRDFVQADAAVDDLLREVDDLRDTVRSLAVLLSATADLIMLGRTPDVVALCRAADRAYEIAGGA